METGKFCVVSSSHVTKTDAANLDALQASMDRAPTMVSEYAQGWIVSTMPASPTSPPEWAQQWRDVGMSDEFIKLFMFARSQGFGLLQLDADGYVIGGAPVFEW